MKFLNDVGELMIIVVLHLILTLIDVAATMLLVRMVSTEVKARWLLAVEAVGRPLTDLVLSWVDAGFAHGGRQLRTEARFTVGILGLVLVRFATAGLIWFIKWA